MKLRASDNKNIFHDRAFNGHVKENIVLEKNDYI